VCFMCEYESSYVYSYVCVKTSFLDDQLVRWFHFSIFGTLSQECCGKTGQEMESCDFSDQTCVNWSFDHCSQSLFLPVVECCPKSREDHVVIDLIRMIHGLVLTSHFQDQLVWTNSCT
jgi:hypothetical protein